MENVGDDENGKKCSIDLFRCAAYEERKKISYDCLMNVFRNSIESVVLTMFLLNLKKLKEIVVKYYTKGWRESLSGSQTF